MSELILHHYLMSPFSQKIRSMLGYANLSWHSVVTTEAPPRPQLIELTGGYRKIPVAQIGADIFCDTRIIAAEIAAISQKPKLALENCDAEVQAYVARADLEVFLACVLTGGTRKLLGVARQTMSLADMGRFILDRVNIGRRATMPSADLKNAKSMVSDHLTWLESQLSQDFLFGDSPNHADFSTWHSLWFVRELAESSRIDPYPNTMAWMDRMKAFGEGQRSEWSAQRALDAATKAEPRAISEFMLSDEQIGAQVLIAPGDYGRDATQGQLVGVDEHRWIIERTSHTCGKLHVHFPKAGFKLKTV